MKPRFAGGIAWIALTFCQTPVLAAPAIDVLRVDLNPLIHSAARSWELEDVGRDVVYC